MDINGKRNEIFADVILMELYEIAGNHIYPLKLIELDNRN